jgi:hypothetical protein
LYPTNKDALGALGAVGVCLAVGVLYYATKSDLGWDFVDVVYCTFATITTVGYGDFNGSNDPGTMIFTMVYGFCGVGIVSLAINELMETLDDLRKHAEHLASLKMAHELSKGPTSFAQPNKLSIGQKFAALVQYNAVTRGVGLVVLPAGGAALIGALILVATEEPDSSIMESNPFITSFYVGIITGLSVGYGGRVSSPWAHSFHALVARAHCTLPHGRALLRTPTGCAH